MAASTARAASSSLALGRTAALNPGVACALRHARRKPSATRLRLPGVVSLRARSASSTLACGSAPAASSRSSSAPRQPATRRTRTRARRARAGTEIQDHARSRAASMPSCARGSPASNTACASSPSERQARIKKEASSVEISSRSARGDVAPHAIGGGSRVRGAKRPRPPNRTHLVAARRSQLNRPISAFSVLHSRQLASANMRTRLETRNEEIDSGSERRTRRGGE